MTHALHCHTDLPIPDASRWLGRLCFHFSRKIEVSWDEHHGDAHFEWGRCLMTADAQGLHIECGADDADRLARLQHVVEEHVVLFSRRAPMVVRWVAGPNGEGPSSGAGASRSACPSSSAADDPAPPALSEGRPNSGTP